MDNCLFCKIVKGESNSYKIYQDEIATAFLDINPVTLGHTLVIPNKHFDRLDSINDQEVMRGLMNAIIKVSNLLISSDICRDFTLLQDNGPNVQQDIMHTHFHIIPRHNKEKVKYQLPTNIERSDDESLKYTYKLLKNIDQTN